MMAQDDGILFDLISEIQVSYRHLQHSEGEIKTQDSLHPRIIDRGCKIEFLHKDDSLPPDLPPGHEMNKKFFQTDLPVSCLL